MRRHGVADPMLVVQLGTNFAIKQTVAVMMVHAVHTVAGTEVVWRLSLFL
jgi:hypothetical protein